MKKYISKGVYVVVDPAMDAARILTQLAKIRNEKIAALQIWENPGIKVFDTSLLQAVIDLFSDTAVPVLINNRWRLCKELNFDGVHFDVLPENLPEIRQSTGRPILKGLTLENDLSKVKKAESLGFDYFSFCSLFPSTTADSCEIVRPGTIVKCRALTQLPVFLAGGINLENMASLKDLPFDGIAMVSSIMKAEDPGELLREFNNILLKN